MRRLRSAGWVLALPVLSLGAVIGIRAFAGPEGSVRPAEPRMRPASAPEVGVPTRVVTHTRAARCRQGPTMIGTAAAARVVVRRAPAVGAGPVATFARVTEQGSAQIFLLEERVGAWYRALLPVRPNGTTGFIRAGDLTVTTTELGLRVDRASHELELWRGCHLDRTFPVAVGKPGTPTPAGRFYLTSLLRPPDPGGVYGAFAYGLSGYSPVIRDWRWGGEIGLHGTDDPASIGRSVSHGCVRMRNRDIAQLVRILPLGTPIDIR